MNGCQLGYNIQLSTLQKDQSMQNLSKINKLVIDWLFFVRSS